MDCHHVPGGYRGGVAQVENQAMLGVERKLELFPQLAGQAAPRDPRNMLQRSCTALSAARGNESKLMAML
jgi:hypothetical protein